MEEVEATAATVAMVVVDVVDGAVELAGRADSAEASEVGWHYLPRVGVWGNPAPLGLRRMRSERREPCHRRMERR